MSGHNKWASIKHKKAATDSKRGKVFNKNNKGNGCCRKRRRRSN
jgi:transcriptional/translational regulatory protein YebC/TACO1